MIQQCLLCPVGELKWHGLQALAEQHAAAIASLEAQHAGALAEAAAKQKQEEQTHQQVRNFGVPN